MDPVQTQAHAMHLFAVMMPMMFLFWLIMAAIVIIPFWQIFKKAGMAPGLAFLIVIPIINLVMIYVLAFSNWKVVPVVTAAYPPAYPPPPPAYPPVGYQPPPPPPPAA